MDHLKITKSIYYRTQCRITGVPYSSFMRWRSRIQSGKPPVGKVGPKPVQSLDLIDLNRQIRRLDHGCKRTLGTGALYQTVSDRIARRTFQEMVTDIRRDVIKMRRKSLCRIDWHMPGMVWAMDDMEYRDPGFHRTHHLNAIRDLASRYIFAPLSGMCQADGHRIASHLDTLFDKHGPPLFMKRDNGSNLNHHAVNRVLADWMVIPLTSPPYYPAYNGSIEQTQSEMKTELKRMVCGSPNELHLLARIAADSLNHRSRPCLDGRTSCQVFECGKPLMKPFHRRRRQEIFEQIQHTTMVLANNATLAMRFDSAWRTAILIWLWETGHVTVINLKKCYPIFSTFLAHN